MAAIPYMPLYIADYLADAAHLSTLEHGAYLLMIMTYWQTGKPLPNDDEKLAKICHLSIKKFQKLKPNVITFFFVNENFCFHKRIEEELEKVRKKSIKSKTNGQKGADIRWSEKMANAIATPSKKNGVAIKKNSHTDTDTDTGLYIKEIVKEKTGKLPARKKQLPPDFGVTPHHRELATKNGWPDPETEIEAFRDYHEARGTPGANWDKYFCTWLRNAKKFAERQQRHGGPHATTATHRSNASTFHSAMRAAERQQPIPASPERVDNPPF